MTRKSTANSPGHNISNVNNSLSPPARGRSRSRSPTPHRRTVTINTPETAASLDSSAKRVQKKKLTINEPVMNSLLTITSTVEEITPEITPIEAVQPNVTQTTQINGGDVKFENISDNGSEISDEGYRSLGLIHNGQTNATDKRASIHSQISTEDADYSGEFLIPSRYYFSNK